MTAQTMLMRIAHMINPTTKKGQRFQDNTAAGAITSSTNATPIEITTALAHGLKTGDQVYIIGHTTNTPANNTVTNPNWSITKVSATKFTLDGSVGTGVGASGTFVGALIGSVDSATMTRQKILDIYNEARMTVVRILRTQLTEAEQAKRISGIIVSKADLTFASGIAAKPSDFIATFRLTDVYGDMIPVLSPNDIEAVRDLESATNRMVFDYGTNFQTLTGSTNVADAATYILRYLGLTTFTLADILGGTVTDPINAEFQPLIFNVAQAIANGQGNAEIEGVVKFFLGSK